MERQYPVAPPDLMELDRALALVLTHGQPGSPWLIGPESAVLDRAKRTVRYYSAHTIWNETRKAEPIKEYNGGDTPPI